MQVSTLLLQMDVGKREATGMRINGFDSIEQFLSQYVGEWQPSVGHWCGLDFRYRGEEYRFQTGRMCKDEPKGLYGLYRKNETVRLRKKRYEMLGRFETIDEVWTSTVIGNQPFKTVIMDDETEVLGQD